VFQCMTVLAVGSNYYGGFHDLQLLLVFFFKVFLLKYSLTMNLAHYISTRFSRIQILSLPPKGI
jgi:hypothetical protein